MQTDIDFDIKAANSTFYLVTALHIAAILALYLTAIQPWVKAILLIIVIASLIFQTRSILVNVPHLLIQADHWFVEQPAHNAQLELIGAFSNRFLVVLNLRNRHTKQRVNRLFLPYDSLSKAQFRQLRLAIKLKRGMQYDKKNR